MLAAARVDGTVAVFWLRPLSALSLRIAVGGASVLAVGVGEAALSTLAATTLRAGPADRACRVLLCRNERAGKEEVQENRHEAHEWSTTAGDPNPHFERSGEGKYPDEKSDKKSV